MAFAVIFGFVLTLLTLWLCTRKFKRLWKTVSIVLVTLVLWNMLLSVTTYDGTIIKGIWIIPRWWGQNASQLILMGQGGGEQWRWGILFYPTPGYEPFVLGFYESGELWFQLWEKRY